MESIASLIVSIIGTLVGTVAGIIVGYLLEVWREKRARAKLEFDDELHFEPFEHSVRVSVRVKHVGGEMPATNVLGLLTVRAEGTDLSNLAVKKNGKCELQHCCNKCGGKTYLASRGAEVRDEPLPWSVPISAGEGLNNLKYTHLTHIPVGGSSLLRLFDVYWAKLYGSHLVPPEEPKKPLNEFWLVKVHSEYGTEHYPRICLKLPIKGNNIKLHFEIKLAGENIKEAVQDNIELKLKNGDCIVMHGGHQKSLRQYFKEKGVKRLELRPKGRAY